MDKRTADACVYPALGLATTLYAVLLDYNKRHAPPDRKIEPRWTYIEVAIGSAICLVAGGIRAALDHNKRWPALRAVGLAFVVGGLPIAVWQEWRGRQERAAERDTLQHYDEDHHDAYRPARPAPRLAPSPQRGARADRAGSTRLR